MLLIQLIDNVNGWNLLVKLLIVQTRLAQLLQHLCKLRLNVLLISHLQLEHVQQRKMEVVQSKEHVQLLMLLLLAQLTVMERIAGGTLKLMDVD